MKTNQVIAIVVGAMALEAVMAYAFWRTQADLEQAPARQERRHRPRAVQETADTRALRKRISELERRLAEAKSATKEEKVEESGEEVLPNGENRFQPPSMQEIRERMERAVWELTQMDAYRYLIVNDVVETAADRLIDIMELESEIKQEMGQNDPS